MRRAFLILALATAVPALASWPDSLRLTPDSLVILTLDPVQVTGDPMRLPVDGGPVKLDALRIRDARGASLADLGPLLPSTRLATNSRGEALFMLRGAPERHLPVFLDGFPLVLPWDERADLSMLPVQALGMVGAQRGIASALQGAGALAGRLDLSSIRREDLSGNPSLECRAGEGRASGDPSGNRSLLAHPHPSAFAAGSIPGQSGGRL